MRAYRIGDLSFPLDHDEAALRARAARELGVRADELRDFGVARRSVDARDKRDIRIVYTLRAALESPARRPGPKARAEEAVEPYRFPAPAPRKPVSDGERPVVVGAGPAGLFCALMLAEAGYRPLLLERGEPIEARGRRVADFWTGGELDPESNPQFGEGGAGAFSDGKLSTGVGDEGGRGRRVLEEFVAAGAPPEILYSGKPHIGTDYLVRVVAGLRRRIEALGGELRFRSRVDGLIVRNGALAGLRLAGGEVIDAKDAVIAVGHSARDTFSALAEAGLPMERKPFALGLRVEHSQEAISRAQYGSAWNHPALGAADYKLTHRAADGRGVYSFCMCPGGYVVDASSEPGLSACNGMSDYARDAPNANSAIVVAVRPEDYASWGEPGSPLAGAAFQRHWERLAWEAAREAAGIGAGRSALPAQDLGSFLAGGPPRLGSGGDAVAPSVRGTWALASLAACLPPFAAAGIREAFPAFGRRIRGFDAPGAALVGVETRTSSPLRMTRDGALRSALEGVYPCGEGAGYAGGIMSAAMDGIRVAEALALSRAGLLG